MRNIFFVTILMCVAFCSCEKVKGNGEITTENRAIDGFFTEVENDTKFDVEIEFTNNNQKAKITGESNIIPKIYIGVKNKKLTIKKDKSKYNLKNTEPVTITIYMNSSDYLDFINTGSGDMTILSPLSKKITFENSGSGDLYAFDCENEATEIMSSGSGDVEIRGITAEAKITGCGTGEIDCYHLVGQFVEIHSSGSGRIEAYATDEADAWISGSGEVYVYGTERVRYHYEYDDK
ncbi:MAG: DUF2807 domain-containing protein [Bacteroidales bacterium]|nr:DUF2807 domain-containing protein [Bacteroidales bacterium]